MRRIFQAAAAIAVLIGLAGCAATEFEAPNIRAAMAMALPPYHEVQAPAKPASP